MTHLSHPHGSLSVMLIGLALLMIPLLISRNRYVSVYWRLSQIAGFLVGLAWLAVKWAIIQIRGFNRRSFPRPMRSGLSARDGN